MICDSVRAGIGSYYAYQVSGNCIGILQVKEEVRVIEVKNLVKKYGNHLAVDNLSFTVKKGEILGFLGPNGAGKSTTMNVITGYISATEGTVTINGHDIYEEPEEAKKSIGYLPELPPLYMDMSVKEYLQFVAELKNVPKKERKDNITYAMKKTGIEHIQNRLIKQLSKGYKQRVGLAQAIMGHPDLIILDEPTVGLDPAQIIEIRNLIKDLSREHAVILSSHILQEISAVCDRIMIINQGKLVVSDTKDNLAKKANGTNIQLTVHGDKNKIHNALLQIKEISKIEYRKEGNFVGVTIYTDSDQEIREAIFYAMAKAECPILAMSLNKMSLEDLFLKVTKQTNKTAKRKNRGLSTSQKVSKEEK